MVTGPVGEHLQAGTEDAPVLDCPVPLRVFMILVPDISVQTYLLTYLKIICWDCELNPGDNSYSII